MAKGKKIDFMKVVKNSAIAAGTGVIAQIASEVISPTNTDYALYGMLAAGIILPEVIKNDMVETAGIALTAVAGYKLSEDNDLVTKLGLGGSTSNGSNMGGFKDFRAVGATANWQPQHTYQAKKVGKVDKNGSQGSSVM